MLIGVLSDTHIVNIADGHPLAKKLLSGPFADVAAIIHAGDHVHPDLSSCFEPVPFYSVSGNMDKVSVDRPISRILSFADKRIGVVHGWGGGHSIEQRVMETFYSSNVDVIVFGHSHKPLCQRRGSVLLFNPGSPTDRRSAPFHSVGILTIGAEVTGRIIALD